MAFPETQAESDQMTENKSTGYSKNTPDKPAAGKGMPAKNPKAQPSLPGQNETLQDSSFEERLELPHERDQAVDMTSVENSPVIEQAAHDIGKGLRDTSKAPEMDRTYKKQKF